MTAGRRDENLGFPKVVLQARGRVLQDVLDPNCRGEMKNKRGAFHQGIQIRAFGNFPRNQSQSRVGSDGLQVRFGSGGKIVDHRDAAGAGQKSLDEMGTYEPGATRDDHMWPCRHGYGLDPVGEALGVASAVEDASTTGRLVMLRARATASASVCR
jgi:hypothetical protein